MTIQLTLIVNQINGKIKTRIYGFCVPVNRLDETIMNSIYNKIENYNKILSTYGYFVSLQSKILWSQNNIKMVNCDKIINCNDCKTCKK